MIKYKPSKAEIIYWAVLYMICISIDVIYIIRGNNDMFSDILFFSLIPLIFSYYYLANTYRCNKFNILVETILSTNIPVKFSNDNKIEVRHNQLEIRPPISAGSAKIYSFPKKTNATYIQSENFLIIFFSTLDFGFFKRYLKPYVFYKSNETNVDTFFNTKHLYIIKKYNLTYENDSVIIEIGDNNYIEMIKLVDFMKYNNKLFLG
jgi:uncharacterized membrane protein